MKRLIAILFGLILTLTSAAEASGWSWTYDSAQKLWWKNSDGHSADGWYYTRSCYYTRGCRHCRRCSFKQAYRIAGYGKSTYSQTAGTESWRTQLLRIKEQQKTYENRLKASALEHNEFMEAVKELGLSGSYSFTPRFANGGLSNVGLAQSMNYGQAPYANQGNTIYGYTQLSEVHGKLNLALHLNQAARLAENAQNLSQQATGGFNTAVDNAGARNVEVAKIIAQGQAAAQALSAQGVAAAQALGAAKPDQTETVRRQSFFFKVVPDENGKMKAELLEGAPNAAQTTGVENRFATLINAKCAKCHTGGESKGGLDFNKAQDFSLDQWKAVWTRVRHPDPARRMPKGPNDTVGTPLTDDELMDVGAYVRAVKQATAALQSKQ